MPASRIGSTSPPNAAYSVTVPVFHARSPSITAHTGFGSSFANSPATCRSRSVMLHPEFTSSGFSGMCVSETNATRCGSAPAASAGRTASTPAAVASDPRNRRRVSGSSVAGMGRLLWQKQEDIHHRGTEDTEQTTSREEQRSYILGLLRLGAALCPLCLCGEHCFLNDLLDWVGAFDANEPLVEAAVEVAQLV